MDATTTAMIEDLYQARKLRLVHPGGTFNGGGRWYPSTKEDCGVSASVRSPSRAWPYSYMTACRSRRHCMALAEQQPEYFTTCVEHARLALARAAEHAA